MKHPISFYKQWGWVTPDGEILDGYTSEFDTHYNLFHNSSDSDGMLDKPIYRGYVRWFTYKHADEPWLDSEAQYDFDIELNIEGCSKERSNEAVKVLRTFAMFNKVKMDSFYWNRQECPGCKGDGESPCSKCRGFGYFIVENSSNPHSRCIVKV